MIWQPTLEIILKQPGFGSRGFAGKDLREAAFAAVAERLRAPCIPEKDYARRCARLKADPFGACDEMIAFTWLARASETRRRAYHKPGFTFSSELFWTR